MPNESHSDEFIEEIGSLSERPEQLQVPDPNLSDKARANRLREAVESSGGRNKVAARAGIHPQSLTRYLSGRDIQSETLVAIADACGVSVEWLAAGRGNRNGNWITARTPGAEPIGNRPDGTSVAVGPAMSLSMTMGSMPAGYVAIPRYNVTVSAGPGAVATQFEQVVDYFAFQEDYLRQQLNRRPEDLALIEARGDSMEPTIRAGDILTVDIRPNQTIEHGMLYVVRYGDNLLVKRIEIRRQSLILHSENPRYAPEPLTAEEAEQLHIIGHVLLVTTPPR